MKGQGVRLFDVFVLGPFMMLAARELGRTRPEMATLLYAAGAGTVFYNALNYLKVAEQG